jgi:hypothetical protein
MTRHPSARLGPLPVGLTRSSFQRGPKHWRAPIPRAARCSGWTRPGPGCHPSGDETKHWQVREGDTRGQLRRCLAPIVIDGDFDMSNRSGASPSTSLVGWVFLDRYRAHGFTIRWRRGDRVAYVLSGQRVGDHGMTDILGTIPVLPAGWTDLAEIRGLGQRWMRGRGESPRN